MTRGATSALRQIGCAVLLMALTATQSTAQTEPSRLSLADAPQAVENLIGSGQLTAAREIALAALRAAPDNPRFMLSLARTETRLGNYASAIALGRKAYRTTNDPQIKFYAAQTVAQAHTSAGNLTRAQLWLRRARQFASNAEIAERVAQDFGKLRAQNPWSTSLSFGITPTSNINNGSANSEFVLPGLPYILTISGDGRPLSGIQISGGADFRYRVLTSENSATFLTASANALTYTLSQSARAQAPSAKGSDYSYGVLSFGVSHRHILAKGANPTEFALRNSRTWYGMDPYSRTIDGSVTHIWKLGETDSLAVRALAQKTVYFGVEPVRPEDEPTKTYPSVGLGISAHWTHAMAGGDSYTLGLTLRDNQSKARDSDYKSVAYSANYDFAKPVAGMRFGFGADIESRNFASSIYAAGPREDVSVGLEMSVNFSNVEFYGFQPIVKFEARRNESSVALFDRNYGNIAFDLRSSF